MKQNYQLSGSFIEEIFRISGGYLEHGELDTLFNLLEAEAGKFLFTKSSENNLLRIINSFFDRGMLLKDAVKYPHYIEILATVSANSNYLCDILVRDPEFFYWIVNPSNLHAENSVEDLNRTAAGITKRYKSFGSKLNALKSFKRKEILRIGLRDLLGITSLTEITEQLSSLAKSILDNLFRVCLDEIRTKLGINLTGSYCIIALGKLGGRELNYSSDTDLMVFYDKDKKTGSRYFSEYLIEAIKLFIDSSSHLTETGYLYRIDLRLRPDGRNSVLCRSINEYLNYYESKGALWERQMLLKSDFISGDISLYNQFISYLTPFIYPVSLQVSPVTQTHKLKSDIEKNLRSELNIKLTKGGIRDIEFIVQVLQLLNGGKIKGIREQNTLKAVEKIASHDLISEDEKSILVENYIFFRRTEHYLQLMNDRQTHTIPEAGEIVDKMSCFLGYSGRKEFLSDLNNRRNAVREIYFSFIPGNEDEASFISVFKNKSQSARDLEYLRKGKELTGEKVFDQGTQNAFSNLEPLFLKIAGKTPDPDLVMRNFTSIIRNSSFPSIWYNQLRDEVLLNYFMLTCSFSERAVRLMISESSLQDFFISRRVFMDYRKDELNLFPLNKFLFYLYVNLAVKKLSHNEVSGLLSFYCAEKVRKISEEIIGRKNYFVAAMGSFGSGEMSFSSDLDLIFVVKKDSPGAEKKFRNILTVINRELSLFKADCRLRPEGEGSQLVWELDPYLKYLLSRGRIWELQALCRLNFITGEKEMFDVLVSAINERIAAENCEDVKKSVTEMRTKTLQGLSGYSKNFYFKRSPGGLTDIEYLLQYLILCTPGLYIKCRGKSIPDTADEITGLSEKFEKLIDLKENYSFLKMLEMLIQNVFDTEKAAYPHEVEKKKLAAAYIEVDEHELDEMFRDKISINNKIFNNFLMK